MCAEHIHFLVTRAAWLVTEVYTHYTFGQSPFKAGFVTMNKLLGANFLTDRRDDIDNFKLEPISDKIGEISFIKKCTNISGNVQYKDFA